MVKKKLISRFVKLLLCLVLFLCVGFSASAQSSNSEKIVFQSLKREINTSNQELENLMLKVQNRTSASLNAVIHIAFDKGLDLVSKNDLSISIKPGDSLYLPVKLFVSQMAQSGKTYFLNFWLTDTNGKRIATAQSTLQVSIKKSVSLFAMVSNILLENNTDSIKIPVRVTNNGNTPQKISVISRYPSIIEGGDFYSTVQLVIPAGKDTLVSFTKPVNGRMFPQEGFDVNIAGLYANGELFSMAYVRIQNARNNRYYQDPYARDSYDNNSITLSSRALFARNESYLLTGKGVVELPQGKIGYNLDVTTYKDSEYSPAMVRNTFVGYEAYNMGIRVGSINKSMDVNLSGKGGLFFVNDTAAHNRYEGGYVNSNTNLLGNGFGSFFQAGEAAWGTFTHFDKKWQFSSSGIYELNPMMRERNMIVTNELGWINAKDFRFSFTLSGGNTNDERDNASGKYSFATGFSAAGSIGKLMINSVNYISSGYYPGSRRGALNFSERLTWVRPSGNIWASIDYYQYDPKYFSTNFFSQASFSNLRAEFGMSGKVFKTVTLSVSPYYSMERNDSYRFLVAGSGSFLLQSWNVNSTMNMPLSAKQYVSLNTEAGVYHTALVPGNDFHFRSNLSYRNGCFNLMTSVQTGLFYVGEILNSYVSSSKSSYIINITPTVQKSFMRNKLRTEFGVNYTNTRISGKSWQITVRTEYEILPKTSFFAALNHNRYTFLNGQYNSSILELGITKNMRSARVGSKNNPLEIFVFKDLNQNGIYDQGDSVANHYLVYVNDVAFMTRTDGTVVYKNLPPGEYRITVPRLKDWVAPDQKINFDQKKRLEIPLQKTGTLRGRVSYSVNQYSYEIEEQKEGLEVIATSDHGQTYLTRTDLNGQYVFFMPLGKYSISIKPGNLPAEVECKNGGQTVEIASGTVSSIDLILKVKQRKIEIKKFTSASLSKTKE